VTETRLRATFSAGCLALFFGLASALHAQNSSISISQARDLAALLLADNKPAAAKDLARALLKADPDDISALFVLAKAERALGNHDATIQVGKRAMGVAQSKSEKFAAAMTVAEAHAAKGSFTASQLWLRRAQQNAPNEALKQRAVRDFQFVRANNPVSVNLRFSIKPSDNVNGGTTSDGMYVNVLGQNLFFATPAAARPLSGTELQYGAEIKLRPLWGEDRRWAFTLDLDAQDVHLSSEAKKVNPDAENQDFQFRQVTVGAEYTFVKTATTQVIGGLSYGRNWYATEHLTDVSQVSLRASRLVRDRDFVGLDLLYSYQDRQDSEDRSSVGFSASAYYSLGLANSARLTFSATSSKTNAQSADYAYSTTALRVSYAPATPILGAKASFGVGWSTKDFQRPLYLPEPRSDQTISLDASFTFDQASYFGFAPVLTFSSQTTDSNVDRFKTEEFGIRLGLKSAF